MNKTREACLLVSSQKNKWNIGVLKTQFHPIYFSEKPYFCKKEYGVFSAWESVWIPTPVLFLLSWWSDWTPPVPHHRSPFPFFFKDAARCSMPPWNLQYISEGPLPTPLQAAPSSLLKPWPMGHVLKQPLGLHVIPLCLGLRPTPSRAGQTTKSSRFSPRQWCFKVTSACPLLCILIAL